MDNQYKEKQFGLIAEDVYNINKNLTVIDTKIIKINIPSDVNQKDFIEENINKIKDEQQDSLVDVNYTIEEICDSIRCSICIQNQMNQHDNKDNHIDHKHKKIKVLTITMQTIESVQYHKLIPLLLNEIIKQKQKIDILEEKAAKFNSIEARLLALELR